MPFCCYMIKTSLIGICVLYISISGYIRSPPNILLLYPKTHNKTTTIRQTAVLRQITKTHFLNLCYLPKSTQTSAPHSGPTPQPAAAAASSHPPQGLATRQTESPSPGSTSPLPDPLGAEAAAVVAAGVVVAAPGCASRWGRAWVLLVGPVRGRVRRVAAAVVAVVPGSVAIEKREVGAINHYKPVSYSPRERKGNENLRLKPRSLRPSPIPKLPRLLTEPTHNPAKIIIKRPPHL